MMNRCSKIRISCGLLALIMVLNAILSAICVYISMDWLRAMFYGINVVVVLLLFCTLAIQSYGYTGKIGEERRQTPYLYSVIGVMMGCTLLLAPVMYLSVSSSINDPVILLSCICILVVYVYIIILRDHS